MPNVDYLLLYLDTMLSTWPPYAATHGSGGARVEADRRVVLLAEALLQILLVFAL